MNSAQHFDLNLSGRLHAALLLGALSLLSGCALGPDYRPPDASALGVPAYYSAPATPATASNLSAWWQTFDDPILTDLVARATAGNLDIQVSEARYRQAREALIQSRSSLFPALSGSAGANRADTFGGSSPAAGSGQSGFPRTSGGSTQLSLGLDASWQLDLFGGISRSIEASQANEEAAGFNLAAVRTAVAGEVASNYITARSAQARLAIARDSLKTQNENLEIAGWRVQAGLAPATDREQARAQRAQTSATIPTLETNFSASVNRLAVLTGQAPGALTQTMAATAPIPVGSDGLAVGVPADTLRQRPDVRAAERQLASASAQIGVAKAQLYPALSLTGSLATAAAHAGGIGNVFTSNLFGGLTQVLLDGGRLRSQVRSARAAADEALANYKLVVLSGLEDVENALQSLRAAKDRKSALIEARDASEAAATLARSQYSSGLTDFQTLLQSEQTLLSARDALASADTDRSTALVQLYLALGGGWQADAVVSTR